MTKVKVNDNFESDGIKDKVLRIGTIANIAIDKSCTRYASIAGELFDASITKLVAFPTAKAEEYTTFPDFVISIENGAFFNSSVKKLIVHKCVESIGNCTQSNLKEIIVDKDNPVYSSRDGVLFNKDRTELLYYPDGRELQEYTIPETVKEIKDNAFSSCRKLLDIEPSEHLSSKEREYLKEIVSRNRRGRGV